MTDAVREINGFNPGIPDWLEADWWEDNPAMCGVEQFEEVYVAGALHQPHTLRGLGFEGDELPYGMHITSESALTKWREEY